MSTDVQTAIIGGGIVGASVLYWLAKLGMTDTVLIERRELTSGSTWHAAGNTTYFGPYPAMTSLFAGSIRTYQMAEAESDQSIGFHQTGSLRLAATEKELAQFHSFTERYRQLEIPYHIRTPAEVADLHPLIDTSAIFGAAHTPTDGHVDPTGATNACASAARKLGAAIERHRPVTALRRQQDHWVIETIKGPITAQNIVMAASFWTRELLEPLGLSVPLNATQHHELITEPVAELQGRDGELPAMRDSYASCNIRQEGQGLLVGIYESEPKFWALDGIPKDFSEDLFPPELDRLMFHLDRVMERVPAFAGAGIKTVNNGPFCFTPDGLPMLGPMPDQEGLWMASGFNVGIGTGGGAGEYLAHWIVNGKPHFDLPAVHADRFGNDMTTEQATQAIQSVYARGYTLPDHI
jgi:dimethylglycine dehydrogenase